MTLAALPPQTLDTRADAWLVAPAAAPNATAWLVIPRAGGNADALTRRAGDTLVVRAKGADHTVFMGGCSGSDDCDAVRSPVAFGRDGFAYAVEAGGAAAYVAAVDGAGRTTVVRADEASTGGIHPLVAAGGATVAWLEGGAILARDGSGARRQVAAAGKGTITSLAVAGARVAWSARAPDGTTRVRVRAGAGKTATVLTERRRGFALGGVAIADNGTVAIARRALQKGKAVIEVVLVTPGVAVPTVAARSAPFAGGAKAELPRLSIAGSLLAYRLRLGPGGRSEAIWVTDLAGRGSKRVTRVARRSGRLSDPSLAPRRVVWTRSDLGAGGRGLAGSSVLSVALRLR